MIRSINSLLNSGGVIPFFQGDEHTIEYVKKEKLNQDVLDVFNISDDYTLDEFCNFNYEISELGFRKSSIIDGPRIDNSPNEIWCFGDSFTFGTGVPLNRTWPSIIQTHTDKKVINFGIGGIGPETVLRLITNWLIVVDHMPETILTYGFFPGRFEVMLDDGTMQDYISSDYNNDTLKTKEMYKKIMSSVSDYEIWNIAIAEIVKSHNINYHHIDIERFNDWRGVNDISFGRDLLASSTNIKSIINEYSWFNKKQNKSKNHTMHSLGRFVVHPGINHHKFIGNFFYKNFLTN